MLTQLPNGNWIDTKRIIGIRVLDRSEITEVSQLLDLKQNPPRVCIELPCGMFEVVSFESYQEAEEYRDHLAQLHNKAK